MRRARHAAAALMLLLAVPPSGVTAETQSDSAPPPLDLATVLRSVDDHYPLLRAAEAERDIAEGALRSALGGFDLQLSAQADLQPEGFYERYGGGAELLQPTRLWGLEVFGGYRIGRGDFPSYYGYDKTNGSGEVRGGVKLPLLRGGAIDERRARLRTSELDRRRAEPEIALSRIGFLRNASVAYWTWVAAGRSVEVARHLLEVAEARQKQIAGRVERGILPEIDLTDNQRLIVDRRIRLRGAERDVEQAAISLSLFLRDADGQPLIPDPRRLPEDFPPEEPPSRARLMEDLDWAAEQHPVLRRFALERRRAKVDVELARNALLPEVDLTVAGSQDFGKASPGIDTNGKLSPSPKDATEVEALIELALPVQRREAKGRVTSATARLSRIESRGRYAGDQIEADIRPVESVDVQIDKLVYDLYGLTEDEIKGVEEAIA